MVILIFVTGDLTSVLAHVESHRVIGIALSPIDAK